ncbi:SsgA family sporulation/cell division regulator [Streptomyces sp. NPDC054949]|uniref:SsgA family sporulation/cell division regulator n=1 Tax=unclassified Streptomyces TaxID=2593676 RepID=UPI0006B0189E|nr:MULTISPECIES: SsgA family sporulation/cell division regulator [unclassified Streptomyces]KOU39777.1 regulator [Streptomyces sp. WM4235]MCX5074432.1 SsgA family sporulation/cell division regulator [Streptomyces sp. NBC_00424]MCX5154039.1 SsgA family sporulation/cell division regulator [Streptomyces sp. NBC_00291]WUD42383.1 SsgA family sporulation/cell division regulator [Streptomyces sp. NBC_00513]
MRESVQAEVMMNFLVSEELSFRIPVELRYDAHDPYAVRLTFHLPGDAPVTWAFGRELLLDGINKSCGEGDVHIAPTDPEELSDVHIRLQVGGDRALFRAGAAPLVAFLDRTDRLVPLGQERTLSDFEGNLDEALGKILDESQQNERNAG